MLTSTFHFRHFGTQGLPDELTVERDDRSAAMLFERGCDLGNGESCFNAGTMALEHKVRNERLLEGVLWW